MSRIAKQPVEIPNGVEINVSGQVVSFKGPKGEITLDVNPGVKIKFDKDAKMDGVRRKKLDTSLAYHYGWKTKMNFKKALKSTIKDFIDSTK